MRGEQRTIACGPRTRPVRSDSATEPAVSCSSSFSSSVERPWRIPFRWRRLLPWIERLGVTASGRLIAACIVMIFDSLCARRRVLNIDGSGARRQSRASRRHARCCCSSTAQLRSDDGASAVLRCCCCCCWAAAAAAAAAALARRATAGGAGIALAIAQCSLDSLYRWRASWTTRPSCRLKKGEIQFGMQGNNVAICRPREWEADACASSFLDGVVNPHILPGMFLGPGASELQPCHA